MYGFSTKVYDNGTTAVGGIIEVPADTTNKTVSTSRYDMYFDVYPTKKEAEQAHYEARKS